MFSTVNNEVHDHYQDPYLLDKNSWRRKNTLEFDFFKILVSCLQESLSRSYVCVTYIVSRNRLLDPFKINDKIGRDKSWKKDEVYFVWRCLLKNVCFSGKECHTFFSRVISWHGLWLIWLQDEIKGVTNILESFLMMSQRMMIWWLMKWIPRETGTVGRWVRFSRVSLRRVCRRVIWWWQIDWWTTVRMPCFVSVKWEKRRIEVWRDHAIQII